MNSTALSPRAIANAKSDDELYGLLAEELTRRIGPGPEEDMKAFLATLPKLPIGLRSMAAVYQLDVSLALDDIGWHFANWHSAELAEETLAGLHELQALSHASAFEEALTIARRHWSIFAQSSFQEQYPGSSLELELRSTNERLWRLQGYRDEPGQSILSHWAPYARKYPDRVTSQGAA
jgi:hypothetical protein